MKNIIISLLLLVAGTSAFAGECIIPKLDLDKVPFPIKSANTKFDLAEGETYILNGTVVKKDSKYYFQIDFESQPYLATPNRIANPYFAIDASDFDLIRKVGSGELVQMAVVIKKIVSEISTVTYAKTESLDILAPPVTIKRDRN